MQFNASIFLRMLVLLPASNHPPMYAEGRDQIKSSLENQTINVELPYRLKKTTNLFKN